MSGEESPGAYASAHLTSGAPLFHQCPCLLQALKQESVLSEQHSGHSTVTKKKITKLSDVLKAKVKQKRQVKSFSSDEEEEDNEFYEQRKDLLTKIIAPKLQVTGKVSKTAKQKVVDTRVVSAFCVNVSLY